MTVLEKICADKRLHIKRKKGEISPALIMRMAKESPPSKGFQKALAARNPALIAEVKKASPSKGVIRQDFDPVLIAQTYEQAGAACLSVLTDEPYFQGKDDDLRAVRRSVSIPILRKDFILDPYQVYESRALGADCILLIMAALDDDMVASLYACAKENGMDTLFEVHDEFELKRAVNAGARMIGVNHRNLKTLGVDVSLGTRLAALLPADVLKVAESGIETAQDITRLRADGFSAFLVGEHLLRAKDIAMAVKNLLKS